MATRSRTTFKKRQKELARMEKQRDKAAKRVQRRLEKLMPKTGEPSDDLEDAGLGLEEPEETAEGEPETPPEAPPDSEK